MLSAKQEVGGNMQDDIDEDDRSLAEICEARETLPKLKKSGKQNIADFIDRWKREDASKVAKAQDSQIRPNFGTRFDVNNYAGGPVAIRDIGVIEKRKR